MKNTIDKDNPQDMARIYESERNLLDKLLKLFKGELTHENRFDEDESFIFAKGLSTQPVKKIINSLRSDYPEDSYAAVLICEIKKDFSKRKYHALFAEQIQRNMIGKVMNLQSTKKGSMRKELNIVIIKIDSKIDEAKLDARHHVMDDEVD